MSKHYIFQLSNGLIDFVGYNFVLKKTPTLITVKKLVNIGFN